MIIVNIAIYYLTSNFVNDGSSEPTNIFYLTLVAFILLLLTLIFLIVSIVKKEERDYKFWFSLGTIAVLIGLAILT
ncbi:MAG: hypothetical protein COA80_19435 [Leeuwenhoekiella sp.]|nr:MAG: hypothetical protein COA80_19435 [Leeuwenhoekiella sp.]